MLYLEAHGRYKDMPGLPHSCSIESAVKVLRGLDMIVYL